MKIYSWNMLYRNRELERAFELVAKSDFDIFCLQEVPKEMLARLQTLPCHIAYRVGMEKVFPSRVVPAYNVILSRYQIEARGEVSFDDYWSLLPLRTRLFVRLMPSRLFAPVRNRGGLYADVRAGETLVRVFCLHLVLAHPALRLKEFERAMLERDPSLPTIVCGDFNIVESPKVSLLNWLLGGRMRDTVQYTRERTHIEKHFLAHELTNALSGKVTHPLSRSQLDHILVSHSFSIKSATVLPTRIGSDHHPIRVEIA